MTTDILRRSLLFTHRSRQVSGLPTSIQLTSSTLVQYYIPTRWYAKWNPAIYKITYNANGGTGQQMLPTSFTYGGNNFNLRANTYTRTGYKFKGWSTGSTGNIVHAVTDTAPTPDVSSMLYDSDRELFAVWYNIIKYDKNHSDASGSSGTMADTDFKAGSNVTLQSNAFSRQHYNFMGWSTTPGGSAAYGNGAIVPIGTNYIDNINLYAVWEAGHTITTKYVDQNGTALRADTTTTVSGGGNYSQGAPNITGYTAIGYRLDNISG